MGVEAAVALGEADTEPVITRASVRVGSIDLLRGLVMIVMALDHVRDYFSPFPWDPTDLSKASAGLFLTRWITHFCAPIFTFLAGTSAYLYARNTGAARGQLQRFLVTRGLWLVFLELTWVSFAWQFAYNGVILQTIWSIGWSMVALALLLYLPFSAVLAVGAAMVLGHNLLDGIHAKDFGAWAPLWSITHEFTVQNPTPHFFIAVGYPLIPWIGVMALGYGFGRLLELERGRRDALLTRIGLAMIAAFFVLRLSNVYGDGVLWQANPRGAEFTALQALNTTKYPPSLQYLLMTIGPGLLLLPLLERWRGAWAERITVFGRVPFFYYMIHIPLTHLLAVIWTVSAFGVYGLPGFFDPNAKMPDGYEPSLLRCYLVWLGIVVALYPACRWYAGYKSRNRDKWWLSYL